MPTAVPFGFVDPCVEISADATFAVRIAVEPEIRGRFAARFAKKRREPSPA
jgi:hypothetical protein